MGARDDWSHLDTKSQAGMHSFPLIIAGFLTVLVWAYLLPARGKFWKVANSAVGPNVSSLRRALVAVVIPARNEADVVARCINSLVRQTCSESIHIFLVDDFSCDNTVQAAREAANGFGKSASLTVIACRPLPPGWTGKLWAVRAGIEAASLLSPSSLLLTDADVVHAPHSIATPLETAESGSYDLVSITGKLECQTFAEKLLIPAFTFFFLMLYPPAWIANSKRRTAGAGRRCRVYTP